MDNKYVSTVFKLFQRHIFHICLFYKIKEQLKSKIDCALNKTNKLKLHYILLIVRVLYQLFNSSNTNLFVYI